MKYNLSEIMRRAWSIFTKAATKAAISFAEALHRSWLAAKAEPVNAARIEAARLAAGVTEAVNTWAGWRDLGLMVEHGSRCLFQVDLIHASKGDGAVYRASFFGASQVQPITTEHYADGMTAA